MDERFTDALSQLADYTSQHVLLSASALDFPAIMAVTLLVAITYLVINLITDVSYALLDPRVRQ